MKIASPNFGVWDESDEMRPHDVRGAMPDTEARVVEAIDAKYARRALVDEAQAERVWRRVVGAVVDAPPALVVVPDRPRVDLRKPPSRVPVEVGEVRVLGTARAEVVRVTASSWVWWRDVDHDAVRGKMHVGAWRRLPLDATAGK